MFVSSLVLAGSSMEEEEEEAEKRCHLSYSLRDAAFINCHQSLIHRFVGYSSSAPPSTYLGFYRPHILAQ